jgi:glycosyltransferase involved in cell wall biosynthesis
LKILQLWAPYRERGGEEFVVNLVTRLLGKDHQVETCIFELDPLLDKKLGPFLALTSFYYNRDSLKILADKIEAFQPDVVLSHNIMPAGSYAIYQWLSRRQIPVAYYVHNFRPYSVNGYCWANGKLAEGGLELNYLQEILHGAWQNSVMRTAWYATALWFSHLAGVWQGIDRWIMISGFMEKKMTRSGVPAGKVVTLRHPWVDSTSGRPVTLPPEPPSLLFIGRISEEKGIRVLIDAWRQVEQSGSSGRLVIAGGGPLVPWLEEQCKSLRNASFVGYADAAMKEALLGDAWALVIPSVWWEPLGLVVYESYERARPVLAARSGGLTETVTDGVTGWLHEPGDSGALAGQILEVFSNPTETRRRGENGLTWLRENTHSDLWVQRMEEILLDCADSKLTSSKSHQLKSPRPLDMVVYLADQNPGHDRSFGISRMSEAILTVLATRQDTRIHVLASRSSQQGPTTVDSRLILPFQTRGKLSRLTADHLHPLFAKQRFSPDIWYYPKGFLPFSDRSCRPSVITIHDTIIQYYRDHYPKWRSRGEYAYWSMMLKDTLRRADRVMTVSESSKMQIISFMARHRIPEKEIIVTYEPCFYESELQPTAPAKENYVIHLASCEPHKRTAQLIRWWHEAESQGRNLPMLHLIGSVPNEVTELIASSQSIVKQPFLEDAALKAAYMGAKALILPSEIEGFGLPALEAYYLGTPVCFTKGTSVEEILGVATTKGGFSLNHIQSFFDALDEVMAMGAEEIRNCGLTLRESYAANKVAGHMIDVFVQLKSPL